MSGDACDFNNMETRAVIKFFYFRQGAEGNSRHSDKHYGNMRHRMPPSKTGWPSLNVVIFPAVMRLVRRTKTVTTPVIIDQIHELIFEVRQISAKSIAEQLGISRERDGSIIHEDLDMRKLSAKWVPKHLNADQNVNGAGLLSKSGSFSARSK